MDNDTAQTTTPDPIAAYFAADDARRERQAEIEDTRARWLGYADADDYLSRASEAMARYKRLPPWVGRHAEAIFMGRTERAR